MTSLSMILMVFALVLLILAALNVPSSPRINLGWAGMACWCASIVLGGFHIG